VPVVEELLGEGIGHVEWETASEVGRERSDEGRVEIMA
jgi:hypothetical protein